MEDNRDQILKVIHLRKYYPIRRGFNPFSPAKLVKAVDDVSLEVPTGKTIAIVGESGCGKSTLARTITMLSPPTSGDVILEGEKVSHKGKKLKKLHKDVQMVFQDPDSSLDPRIKIKDLIAEPLWDLEASREAKESMVTKSLLSVGLAEEHAERLPTQISGGQKQRVAIARAMASQPKLIILDEPTSALDASVQAQILRLLLQLQKEFNLTYILITHNLAVAHYLSDSMAVMYAGNIVEHGPTKEVVSKPRHPYTIALISSVPTADPNNRKILTTEIIGEVPSALDPPSGCKFHPRCPFAEKICETEVPEEREISLGHFAACHFLEKTA